MVEGSVLISFRYHLVTIVAVFLALGLGLLAGTTVVDQGLVNRLKEQTHSANRAVGQAHEENDLLMAELRREDGFAAEGMPVLTADRLRGEIVVIVTDGTTDGALVKGIAKVVEGAGGEVSAVIALTSQIGRMDEGTKQSLAQLLGLQDAGDVDLVQEAATQMASRLAVGARGANDLLLELLDEGFLAAGEGTGLKREAGTLPGVGGPDQLVIVVSGGTGDPPVPPDSFLIPLAVELERLGSITVAAEGAAAADDFVPQLRDLESSGVRSLATIDNADEASGELALVLSLEQMTQGESGGNFGFKSGADALSPPVGR